MKKPNFDLKKKHHSNKFTNNNNYKAHAKIEEFNVEKLKHFPDDVVEIFQLIQAVRCDKIRLQEEYNQCRLKLSSDRMKLESEVIKIKKQYNAKISALQEEYNSVKSNNAIELAKLRES